MAILFISITGQIKSSIFEGGVFVDVSFTVFGKNGNNQLGNNRKKDIENVLNEEFCNLNAHSEDNSCFIQSLDFLVKKDYPKKTGPWNGHSSVIFPSLKPDGISKDGTNIICTS